MVAKLSVILVKQDNGSYFALCPDIKGCYTQGDTFDDALAMIKELAEFTIEEYDDDDKDYLMRLSNKPKVFSEVEVNI